MAAFFKKEVKKSHLIAAARDAVASCLKNWFHASLREQIDTDLTIIPEYLRQCPITAETLTELYDGGYLDVVLYDCPVCEEPVQMKPTEVNKFSDFFEVANNVLGQPKDRVVNDPHLSDLDLWKDLFHDGIQIGHGEGTVREKKGTTTGMTSSL
ncbi:hypothetical protein BKA83DRAFT_4132876 [Pisolithus microcarpus]|nr:hypothetical protein BKA83DRAFT_4132876 [Pisolithus microcarpus]